jgi:hypothetical protein
MAIGSASCPHSIFNFPGSSPYLYLNVCKPASPISTDLFNLSSTLPFFRELQPFFQNCTYNFRKQYACILGGADPDLHHVCNVVEVKKPNTGFLLVPLWL